MMSIRKVTVDDGHVSDSYSAGVFLSTLGPFRLEVRPSKKMLLVQNS